MRTARPRRSSAFTLLELVLVMVVLAIVIGMVAPSLSGSSQSRQLRDAASHLVGVARWARTQAVSEGCAYRLNLDTQAGVYWLTAQLPDGTFVELADEMGSYFEVPEGFSLSWDGVDRPEGRYITFTPDGRTEAAFRAPAGGTDDSAESGTLARAAAITLTAANGTTAQIACLSPTEEFRVLPAATEAGGPMLGGVR